MKINQDIVSHFAQNPDIIIFSTNHSYYKDNKFINLLIKQPKALLFDTMGILNEEQITILSKVHTLKILGRGDL